MCDEKTPLDPPEQPPVNRVLGATSGPSAGNVRAILAVIGVVSLHLILTALLFFAPSYHEAAAGLLSAVTAADIGIVNHYFGRRSGEGA